MKCDNIIQRLINKAMHSQCRFKVAAIGIDHRGRIIGCTNNSSRFLRKGGGIHAEQKLLMTCPKSLRTIIIARVNKNGGLLPISPCRKCLKLAAKHGVKIVEL